MRLSPAPVRSRTRGALTVTGPRPVMIARSGRWPWRTSRWRPSSVCLSAWPLRKAVTSASTPCANRARAPSRRTSVSGSENSAGWISLTTLSWVTACHSFGGEVEARTPPRYAASSPHAVTNLPRIPHHPPFQEARSDATGSVAHDFRIAAQDLSGAVDRLRLDLLTRHPRAVLAGPSATPRPRQLWNLIEREVPADPADHGVAGREGAFDQPSSHEPGIEQDAHPAEPVAKQAQREAGALELAAMGATADQAQHQRHRSDLPIMFDDRGQAQPALATQEPRPVRLSRMIVMDQRPRRPGGNPLDQRVIEDHVPDRRVEQHLEHPQQGLPDGEPCPAAALKQPVVRGPAARQPGRQDRVRDVAASGRRRSNEQFREGDAGAPRHSGGDVADEQAQDRRDGDDGHRLSQPGTTRGIAPRCRFNRSKPPTLSPTRGTPRCPPVLSSSKSVRRSPFARSCRRAIPRHG